MANDGKRCVWTSSRNDGKINEVERCRYEGRPVQYIIRHLQHFEFRVVNAVVTAVKVDPTCRAPLLNWAFTRLKRGIGWSNEEK